MFTNWRMACATLVLIYMIVVGVVVIFILTR